MILCIDIGGTMIKSGLLSKSDDVPIIREFQQIKTNALTEKGKGIQKKVIELVECYRQRFDLSGVAISTAGIVDPDNFDILYANENIPEYLGVNFSVAIRKKFQLPCIVENDVNAATIAEWLYGAGEKCSSMMCLTLGTGVGGGIILDQKLFRGANNSAAEIGYMILGESTMEKEASTASLIQRVSNVYGYKISGKNIFDLARKGDTVCVAAIQQFVHELCIGIINCNYLLDLEKIVIGGGISAQKEYLEPLVRQEMSRLAHPIFRKTDVQFAKLGNHAGMIGASILWKERFS